MTKQEQHELRLRISKLLKQTQVTLTVLPEEILVKLEADLKETLKSMNQ